MNRPSIPVNALSQYERWMDRALDQACLAERSGEVPVGAVLLIADELVAEAHNSPILLEDPTAHAEMLVLREAAAKIGNYRLTGATLFVTLEPCAMCAGALVNARVERLVFGCRDLRFGAVRSKFQIADSGVLNHRVEVVEGIRGAECTALIKGFFGDKRRS
ncbi:MAG TPA: tRNA adenosine(34) deaminase TadA [Bryobacteraceae bacterium]